MSDIENLCFLCLTYERNIISQVDNYLQMQEELEILIPQDILQETNIPKHVCDNCSKRLKSTSEFRKMCLKNVPIFNKYIQNFVQQLKSKHLSEDCTDFVNPRNSEIFNKTHNIERTEDESNQHTKIKSEIFDEFESSNETRTQDNGEMEQVIIKAENTTENICLENKVIEEIIIKEEPCFIDNDMQENGELEETGNKNVRPLNEEQNIPKYSSNNGAELTLTTETPKKVVKPVKKITNKGRFECSECHKIFRCRRDLVDHKTYHTGDRPHGCEICQKTFTHLKNLRRHELTHSTVKQYGCEICHKKFNRLDHLNQHKSTHKNEKSHVCEICQKSFTRADQLNSHKRIHSDENPFVCDVCQKKFIYLSQLNMHKRTHLYEKPFSCDVCPRSFIRLDYLNAHKVIHRDELDEVSYTCDVCEKTYKQFEYFNAHKLKHSSEKRFVCDVCPKQFSRSNNLKRHKQTHNIELDLQTT